MAVIQVKLNQVLSEFKDSLHSIDLRVAAGKSDSGWHNVLMGIRVSTRSVEEVHERHLELEKRFGNRKIEKFAVLMHTYPFSEWEELMRALTNGQVEIEGIKVIFPKRLTKVIGGVSYEVERSNQDELVGQLKRYQDFLLPWGTEVWPGICFSTGERSSFCSQPDVTRALRAQLGANSVDELVSTFLELKEHYQPTIDFFIHIEMPAKILTIKSMGKTVEVEVVTEKQLRKFRLFMKREHPQGKLRQRQELQLQLKTKDDHVSLWKAIGELESVDKEDSIICTLTHENGFELDEEIGRLWEFMSAPEKNPLLECVKQFRDMNTLTQQIERPYKTQKKEGRGPQDLFQESITLLLSLAGFQAIDLGRDDKLRHPDTKVERATLDILAYHKDFKIIVLGACTMTTPKNEDFDKLLHAKAILSHQFPSHSDIRLVPVLFSGQENEVESQGETKLINPAMLAMIRRVIESGEEIRFLRFLGGWPFDQLSD